jgi:hypothetical protein
MEEVFTDEATIQDMADRWNLNAHQISYIVRTRKISHTRKVGTSRIFSRTQQEAIYAHFHRYLQLDETTEPGVLASSLDTTVKIVDYDEEECLEREALDEWKLKEDQRSANLEALVAQLFEERQRVDERFANLETLGKRIANLEILFAQVLKERQKPAQGEKGE